jgi:hypothetical protein
MRREFAHPAIAYGAMAALMLVTACLVIYTLMQR